MLAYVFLAGVLVGGYLGFVVYAMLGLCGCNNGPRRGFLNLWPAAVAGKESVVNIIDRPGIEFVDVEKVLLSIAPKDADGRTVNVGPYVWVVTDQVPGPGETGVVVTLQVADDQMSAWAISGAPGTAIVAVNNADVTERIPVTIKYGAPSELNLSAGAPVPEA